MDRQKSEALAEALCDEISRKGLQSLVSIFLVLRIVHLFEDLLIKKSISEEFALSILRSSISACVSAHFDQSSSRDSALLAARALARLDGYPGGLAEFASYVGYSAAASDNGTAITYAGLAFSFGNGAQNKKIQSILGRIVRKRDLGFDFLLGEVIAVSDSLTENVDYLANIFLHAGIAENSPWLFWQRWHQRILQGKPLDWELQRKVSQIRDSEWTKGPTQIARLIEIIETDFLAEKLSLAETVEFNASTAKFHTSTREIAKPDLLGATMSQVEDMLDDVLADPSNGLNDRSREVRVLKRTVQKYGNDPQRIEMDFTSVHAAFTRQIVCEDLPPSEENLSLQRALEEGAQAIRATHAEVAENRRILDRQKFAELTEDQKVLLAEAQSMLEAISEGAMHDDFAEDIPFLLEERFRVPSWPPRIGVPERNPVLAGYDETRRTFGRVAQIAVLLRKSSNIVHALDGSAGIKAGRMVLTIAGLVALGIALIL